MTGRRHLQTKLNISHSTREYKQVCAQCTCEKKCVCLAASCAYNVETRQAVNQSRHVTANYVTLTQLSILIATYITTTTKSPRPS